MNIFRITDEIAFNRNYSQHYDPFITLDFLLKRLGFIDLVFVTCIALIPYKVPSFFVTCHQVRKEEDQKCKAATLAVVYKFLLLTHLFFNMMMRDEHFRRFIPHTFPPLIDAAFKRNERRALISHVTLIFQNLMAIIALIFTAPLYKEGVHVCGSFVHSGISLQLAQGPASFTSITVALRGVKKRVSSLTRAIHAATTLSLVQLYMFLRST